MIPHSIQNTLANNIIANYFFLCATIQFQHVENCSKSAPFFVYVVSYNAAISLGSSKDLGPASQKLVRITIDILQKLWSYGSKNFLYYLRNISQSQLDKM